MKVGDLVRTMGTVQGSKLCSGIIIRLFENPQAGFQVYEVMLENGTVDIFTSAAIRKLEDTQ